MTTEITIHTDGCCKGNPGRGGYAAVVRRREGGVEVKKRVVKGSSGLTTNNQMELMAAISGLSQIRRDEQSKVIVFSDSQYLVLGMNERLMKWQKNNWRTASGKPVKNQAHWERLLTVASGLSVEWRWVQGHSGDPLNEEADLLANAAASCVKS
ncbi:ribonuclease HI [Pontivivens insulae]|uniref:Ribonuclease H n=1 Tax=Pontivivens insulae TaxID=1639689 RepID=A0A2R8A9U2_9RHOB|nr:ribonuclease HI [Pontivivens insulae]RED12892.1 ribonuclease HI [Pontivivens insulae]SPF28984.1 Ribonuclease HI [Pontivivens insulae]